VIARLNEILNGRQPDPLRELLADLVERGELNGSTARRILGSADARDQSETNTLSGTK
jgi:hypothetical protein